MKYIGVGLLVLLLFTACKTDTPDYSPKQGQYIAEYENITAALHVGSRLTITVYKDRHYAFQDLYTGTPSGAWPEYVYTFRNFTLYCSYSDQLNFKSVCSSDLLPANLTFRYDNRVLDANGDGILD